MDHVTTFKLNKVISLYLRSEIKEKKKMQFKSECGSIGPTCIFSIKT